MVVNGGMWGSIGRSQAKCLLQCVIGSVTALALSDQALALPSYAQQSGLPCTRCHTLAFGPGLTAYGRQFKLNAYDLGNTQSFVPISAMVLGGFSRSSSRQPAPPADNFYTNNNFSLDQASLFYAGRITNHLGALVQVTYNGIDRTVSWDNLDVRYARAFSIGNTGIVAGIEVNNNPTVQDLWNTTPAWGFPYVSSPLVPGPAAAPLIAGGLAQTVLGSTAYVLINDLVYLEAGGYRGLSDHTLKHVGVNPLSSPHMDGLSPYWRATLQFSNPINYYSIGLLGMTSKLQPDTSVPMTDRYRDIGIDGVYQYTAGVHHVTANAAWIHEQRDLEASFASGASDASSNSLNSLLINVDYIYNQTWSSTVAWFDTRGTSNQLLYASAELSGSANGSPDTRGYTLQFEYVPFGKENSIARPWLNVRLGLQYTGYLRFNGGSSDYDGFGRSAQNNNSLYAFYWLAF